MLKCSLSRLSPGLLSSLLALLCVSSCATDSPRPARLALIDPLGILDDVTSDLQLLVLPAEGHPCGADGRVEPSLPDTPGATIDGAVVNISFAIADGASVLLDPGTYTVLVRGRGTDPISGVGPNELIATGCSTGVEIAAAETREVSVEMKQIINGGVCGDGVLSPDEQCEGTTPSPCMSCRTSSYAVSTTPLFTGDRAARPSLAFSDGGIVFASYDSFTAADGTGSQKVRMMVLDQVGQRFSSGAIASDELVDVGATVSGIQTQSAVASSPPRIAVAFGGHFVGGDPGGDALVRFFDASTTSTRNPLAAPVAATASSTGAQGAPAIALMSDGTALVAFTNDQSATGASVRLFAAGSTSGMGADAAPLGAGLSAIEAPSVAATESGFVVAFASAGDVYYQRFLSTGETLDSASVLVTADADGLGVQSAAQVAALPDGRFSVGFLDEASGTLRARTFDALGAAVGSAIDLSGPGSTDLDLAAGRERFAAVWLEGGAVRARLLDGSGQPALNRESMPSGDSFVVASGATAPSVAAGGPVSQGLMVVGFVSGGALQARLYPIP